MATTRLAIATSDGVSVCDHLARSASFVILELDDRRIAAVTVRQRANGACGNHRSFAELLSGCTAVICGGIGQGAADLLGANGVESLVTAFPLSINEAIAGYLAGTLATTQDRVCLCG
jgi:predicted Fe-Mo cluster-binding NifX family protein